MRFSKKSVTLPTIYLGANTVSYLSANLDPQAPGSFDVTIKVQVDGGEPSGCTFTVVGLPDD